jgi:hypothetical protein
MARLFLQASYVQIYYKVLHDGLLSDHDTLDEKLNTNHMAISPFVAGKNLYGHCL